MKQQKQLTTARVRRALERLNRGWPSHLRIFVVNGELCLYEGPPEDALTDSGAADSSKFLDSYPRITADGGGW